ncbi:hypothetical protein SRHO_G00014680 [Serrasalmus rhombeus]
MVLCSTKKVLLLFQCQIWNHRRTLFSFTSNCFYQAKNSLIMQMVLHTSRKWFFKVSLVKAVVLIRTKSSAFVSVSNLQLYNHFWCYIEPFHQRTI